MPALTLLIKPVSNICNMRCGYCFYADVSGRRDVASYGAMSRNTLEALTRKAMAYAEGACSIGFQGGEPTLAGLDYFKEFVKLQRGYNRNNARVSYNIQTNGYRVDAEWAEFFAANGFLVGLSMDGTKRLHDDRRIDAAGLGTFDRVAGAAALLHERDVDFNILCTVTNDVASRPKEVYSALRQYRYLQFTPCLDGFDAPAPPGCSLETPVFANFLKTVFDLYYDDAVRGGYTSVRVFENYISVISGRPAEQCGMNGRCGGYFLVEADGGVYPCDFYALDEWKIGDVNVNSFTRFANCAATAKFIETSLGTHADCAACKWKNLCRGGCRRYWERPAGSAPQKSRHCEAYIEFFEYSYARMVKLAKTGG